MTTKIIEAEVQSLPVCRGCQKPAKHQKYGSGVSCPTDNCPYHSFPWISEDQWRLLMTPEAKGVGDEELEKVITEIKHELFWKNPNLNEKVDVLIRAARQRKPSGSYFDVVFSGEMPNLTFVEVEDANGRGMSPDMYSGYWVTCPDGYKVLRIHTAKSSGDAVRLAEMVKKQMIGDGTRVAIEDLADSILAQAAAGETKQELVVKNCTFSGGMTLQQEFAARVPAADLLTACSDMIEVVHHEKGESVNIAMRSIDTWGESWWWYQKSRDGKIVCISETFDSASDARRAANEQAKKLGGVKVVDLTQKGV